MLQWLWLMKAFFEKHHWTLTTFYLSPTFYHCVKTRLEPIRVSYS